MAQEDERLDLLVDWQPLAREELLPSPLYVLLKIHPKSNNLSISLLT
jgi:hypothetical protein